MFKTCWEISKYLPFLALNSLALFTNGKELYIDKYRPKWTNFTVVVSEHVSDKGPSIPRVIKFTHNGEKTEQVHVSDHIFHNIINIQMVPKNRKEDLVNQGWKHIGDIPDDTVVLIKNDSQ
jgi:hypothetical protein